MRDAQPSGSLSDILLERYALNELSPTETRRVEARLAVDPALRERLDALRLSNEDILKHHSPESVARQLQNRLRRERVESEMRGVHPGWVAYFWLKPAAVAALLISIISVTVWQTMEGGSSAGTEVSGTQAVDSRSAETNASADANTGVATDDDVPSLAHKGKNRVEDEPLIIAMNEPDPSDPFGDDTRIKGFEKGLEPALALFRKTARGAEPLQPGAKARAGDVLRIGYRSGGLTYGAIFSVDGHGNVTRHWPLTGDSAGRLERGEALLPGAFELDAAPEYERFYLLASKRAFNLYPVLESLHDQKPPVTSDKTHDISVVRFDILKDTGI